MRLKDKLEKIFTKEKFCLDSETGEINYLAIKDSADKIDKRLIEILVSDKELKTKFFKKIEDVCVFNAQDFKFFLDESKIDNSYTKYANRIGLSDNTGTLKDKSEVVLNFPFKDCVLEGGQSKEEGKDVYFEHSSKTEKYKVTKGKRNEIFFNQVLAHDEIDRLFDRKVLVNWRRFTKNSTKDAEPVKEIKREETGTIKDNLIIKGNNLLALHTLKSNFTGKVKLIYIDPPYNTGNDSFKYNDNFTHSTWLTFMKNRLEVSKDLLSDDGVIFVHCDDNEQAYLKVLMDEIFGRDNFVGTLIHQRAKGGGQAKHIVKGHDYVCIFSKNLTKKQKFIREKVIQSKIVEKDGVVCLRNDDVVRKVFGKYSKDFENRRCFYEELQTYKNKEQISKIQEKIDKGFYVLEKLTKNKSVIVEYKPVENAYSKIYSIINALSTKGTEHLEELGLAFDRPKPEEIIDFIIHSVTKKGDIVLDYHLGSGTTCAVAHKRGRQYIGVEQMDYVETTAVERLKKVIAGEQGGISKNVDWKGGGEFVYCELAVWNEKAKEEIKIAKDLPDLVSLFDSLYEKYFLNYNVKIKDFKEKIIKEKDFKNLSLTEQKKMFLTMLDLNQMYVHESEMDDKKFVVSKEDKRLTKDFYKKK